MNKSKRNVKRLKKYFVETLESLPVYSFNGVIISSARVCTLQSPFVFLFLIILIYTSLKVRYLPVFVSRL